ncbi:MAG: hypothetical protein NUV54_01860 [Candidatus Taylorbacteria bacterium]|nr:hypothetical protein [Candidatus Taylorbacteria bacterium]
MATWVFRSPAVESWKPRAEKLFFISPFRADESNSIELVSMEFFVTMISANEASFMDNARHSHCLLSSVAGKRFNIERRIGILAQPSVFSGRSVTDFEGRKQMKNSPVTPISSMWVMPIWLARTWTTGTPTMRMATWVFRSPEVWAKGH